MRPMRAAHPRSAKLYVSTPPRKKCYFSKTKHLLVMFYRHNKTFWYQFCNFEHFLKAENSEDSLASSCVELAVTVRLGYYTN